eukprot:1384551-Prymnesium_polylepis.1
MPGHLLARYKFTQPAGRFTALRNCPAPAAPSTISPQLAASTFVHDFSSARGQHAALPPRVPRCLAQPRGCPLTRLRNQRTEVGLQ